MDVASLSVCWRIVCGTLGANFKPRVVAVVPLALFSDSVMYARDGFSARRGVGTFVSSDMIGILIILYGGIGELMYLSSSFTW